MIIQSSNEPIILIFEENVETDNIRATLWNEDTKLKEWDMADMTIDGQTVTLPLTQEETKEFPKCRAKIEVKWLNSEDFVKFSEDIYIAIGERKDKEVITGGASE